MVIQKPNCFLFSMGCRLSLEVWLVNMWAEFFWPRMGFIYGPVINVRVPVTTAWRVLSLGMEVRASRYGGWLRIHWISSHGPSTNGGPPTVILGMVQRTRQQKKCTCYESFYKALHWEWFFRISQDRDRWQALVNAVMNLLVTEDLLDSQEGLCSMEFISLYTESFVNS